MSKKVTITIRLDEELYKLAKSKSDKRLCMHLATLIRVFFEGLCHPERACGFFVGKSRSRRSHHQVGATPGF